MIGNAAERNNGVGTEDVPACKGKPWNSGEHVKTGKPGGTCRKQGDKTICQAVCINCGAEGEVAFIE